jgi:NAD+ kinase
MKILVTPNATRDKGYAFTKELVTVLADKGAAVYFETEEALVKDLRRKNIKLLGKLKPELVISIGGDGTFLKSAHTAVSYNVPIFGFNLGNLGFLAELEKQEIDLADNLFTGSYTIEERLILNVGIYGPQTRISNMTAINEVVIHRNQVPRLLDITLFSDNRKVTEYRADGIIISTPTGSTGYAISAGGPVTDPSLESMISVPICAHSFKAYPIVFSAKSKLALLAAGNDGAKAYYSLDGALGNEIGPNDIESVQKSDKRLKIMKLKNQTFTEIINKKFIDSN